MSTTSAMRGLRRTSIVPVSVIGMAFRQSGAKVGARHVLASRRRRGRGANVPRARRVPATVARAAAAGPESRSRKIAKKSASTWNRRARRTLPSATSASFLPPRAGTSWRGRSGRPRFFSSGRARGPFVIGPERTSAAASAFRLPPLPALPGDDVTLRLPSLHARRARRPVRASTSPSPTSCACSSRGGATGGHHARGARRDRR